MLHLADRFQAKSFYKEILDYMTSDKFDLKSLPNDYVLKLLSEVDKIQLIKDKHILGKIVLRAAGQLFFLDHQNLIFYSFIYSNKIIVIQFIFYSFIQIYHVTEKQIIIFFKRLYLIENLF